MGERKRERETVSEGEEEREDRIEIERNEVVVLKIGIEREMNRYTGCLKKNATFLILNISKTVWSN